MGYYILGGCIVIYSGAFVLRWAVKGYTAVANVTPAPHNVRYGTIGMATLLLLLLTAIGESRLQAPDYTYLWTYLVSGLIVLGTSVGYAYWQRARARTVDSEGPTDLIGFDPWGYRRPRRDQANKNEEDEDRLEELILMLGFALMMAAVVLTTSYGVEPEAVIGLFLAPVFWLADGFVTATTNPFYLGGLVIGIGTGWILRGALSE